MLSPLLFVNTVIFQQIAPDEQESGAMNPSRVLRGCCGSVASGNTVFLQSAQRLDGL